LAQLFARYLAYRCQLKLGVVQAISIMRTLQIIRLRRSRELRENRVVFFAWQPSPARSNCPMPTPKKAAAPKNALSKPVQPDAALAAVVGKDPLPRTELTKKLWEYIRKHELQDPKDKRNIRADEKLLAVFDGKKVVSMFEMTKLVNGHLVKHV
jgi:chromatin remodeling complex protein RSC6